MVLLTCFAWYQSFPILLPDLDCTFAWLSTCCMSWSRCWRDRHYQALLPGMPNDQTTLFSLLAADYSLATGRPALRSSLPVIWLLLVDSLLSPAPTMTPWYMSSQLFSFNHHATPSMDITTTQKQLCLLRHTPYVRTYVMALIASFSSASPLETVFPLSGLTAALTLMDTGTATTSGYVICALVTWFHITSSMFQLLPQWLHNKASQECTIQHKIT